ncbi:MAG: methionine ABC transporter permease [Fusobacterium sp. JB021]|nr:methionine ABC transporter permease [Fusobacterium sp. JB020]MDP0493786.1 methionine ABC transporter permease [Fusobacterium sp. JB021]MDP0506454.1 methionine ABC transporter permease [Fusobacterium sp. JB019]MDP0506589.1 methionine ABC transporter permease [Fusobacterium sp. JB019]
MVFNMIFNSTLETLYMVLFSTLFSLVIGFPIGILLVITKEGNIWEKQKLNQILEFIINTLRSFPFIILMICLFPLSRIIVGTTIGVNAAIVPLSISAAPFVARIVEGALNEIDKGLIEASSSMGANNLTIIFKVMIPETLPHLIHGITVTIISLIGYSAMAGTIGAGGLGDLAIRFGYQRFKVDIMIYAVIVIIILVQLIQSLGNYLVYRTKKNR